ncbi:copper homeostasis protein CutC [Paenibacillus guangzhouensis]|uniref:copper homeostasis protein CutC n=1 Tax=Paenibacillus guangzhouensis TaxID=1473112 RepID=UPI0012672B7C|nr:copper homeostasis protein CutC [Paenibacillus guangzhouensis]
MRQRVMLEVIATTLTEVKAAAAYGADRIELITAMQEGGLTPSIGLIEEAVRSVSIPVNVMVRPHSRSFEYDREDIRTILSEVRHMKRAGANAIVFGALTSKGEIDIRLLERVLDRAGDMKMTFHRAIDEVQDQMAALEQILQYPQITTILTSGGQPNVLHAVDRIQAMVARTAGTHCTILAGSGLSPEAAKLAPFLQSTGVQQVHFGSGVRVEGKSLAPIDAERMAAVRAVLNA